MTLYVYTVSVIKKGKFNMANYLQLGQGLMKHLPTAEGCTSTVKLSKKGIEALAKKNPELGKVIEGMTRGAENPTLEIAQKAKGNYAIAGFKVRNGKTVLGKGAYSTSTGANGVVEKMHVESGDIITTVTKEGDKVVSKDVTKADLEKLAVERLKKQISNAEDAEKLAKECGTFSRWGSKYGLITTQNRHGELEQLTFEQRNQIRKLDKQMIEEKMHGYLDENSVYIEFPFKKYFEKATLKFEKDGTVKLYSGHNGCGLVNGNVEINKELLEELKSDDVVVRANARYKVAHNFIENLSATKAKQISDSWRPSAADRARAEINILKSAGYSTEEIRQIRNPECMAQADFSMFVKRELNL